MEKNQPLLASYQMGDLTLKNRIIMAPMTRNRANNPENSPTDLHATYYQQRVSAGLIITEGSQVSPRAVGYINTPGIHSQEQVEGWKKVTEAIHNEGGKIFIQLWHCGAMSHPKFHNGELPLAPSAVNPNAQSYTIDGFEDTVTPKEMSLEEIQQTINEFKIAAENAKKANFDGIEIHSSNGYLFHQFFNANSNQRNDQYGGNIENRTRFFFEVLEEVKTIWPENRIGIRLNPSLHGTFGIMATEETIPTFDHIVEKLNEYNLAYLHLSEPFTDVSDIKYLVKDIAKHYRPKYNGTLMINTNFDQHKGNEVLDQNLADLVAYGKPFISNPDLAERFKANAPLAKWNENTFYTTGAEGYIDYPKYTEEVTA